MKLNLPDSLESSDVYTNDPFPLFEIENILDEKTYKELLEEFPDSSFFNKKRAKLGNKSSLSCIDSSFFEFLEQSSIWKSFYLTMNSETMVKKLFRLMMNDLNKIPERSIFPRKITLENIKLVKKWRLDRLSKLYNKISYLFKPKTNRIRIFFEFSRLENDCFVPPHTEADGKIFTLLIYFPSQNISEFDKERLGTNFYKRTKNNLDIWDSEQMDEAEVNNFYKNYDIFYTTKYSKNKLSGFIKTSNSWHDTNRFDNLKEDRKALIMFFYQYHKYRI